MRLWWVRLMVDLEDFAKRGGLFIVATLIGAAIIACAHLFGTSGPRHDTGSCHTEWDGRTNIVECD